MAQIASQAYEVVPLDGLKQHPENPNEGDVGAISESIEENDFYGAVIMQKSTGYVLAGNHRFRAAAAAGLAELPAIVVDVTDEQARKILVADNRIGKLASWNEPELAGLLSDILAESGDLAGTGYDNDDLDDLLRRTGMLGQQASGFLDDYIGGGEAAGGDSAADGQAADGAAGAEDDAAADEEPAAGGVGDYVQVAWTISPEDRDVVKAALKLAQGLNGLETSAAALVAIARQYLEEHPAG
ncbi:hypothetical protein GCM10023196_037280 [Actinoallomurus vinaceus]|uniref:ParB-like N-terminal domain-containing protein n=1 Tax=Actinoallomurus vinaceus TaxID=1080074 RepID=A0ABP8U9I3_9ACTN